MAISVLRRFFKRPQCQQHISSSLSFYHRPFSTTDVFVETETGRVKTSSGKIYQIVIGLEIHAQLNVASKLFSPASNNSIRAAANANIHPFDVAVPGTLPVLNKAAVIKAVQAARALNCTIAPVSRFERKHYVYADLPHGYQITQQRWPLATDGQVLVEVLDSDAFTTHIHRIQLEIDTAKTTTGGRVDANRAGSPLIEIVTAPDLSNAPQAVAAVTTIRQLLRPVCDGRMEHGQLRVDCNINLLDTSNNRKTPRVEVKNLNSLAQLRAAVAYEAERQATTSTSSTTHNEETRTWNPITRSTTRLRTKEGADDYRFLPEPDLPPIVIDDASSFYGDANNTLTETPTALRERLEEILPPDVVRRLLQHPDAVPFWEAAAEYTTAKVQLANVVCNELVQYNTTTTASEDGEEIPEQKPSQHPLTPRQVGIVVDLMDRQVISTPMSKRLLKALATELPADTDPVQVVTDRNWQLVTDGPQLQLWCQQAIKDHPAELLVFQRGGKFVWKMEKLFTGKVMKMSHGRAHPERLREVVQECLREATAKQRE